VRIGQVDVLLDLIAEEVRQAEVTDLAGPRRVVKEPQSLVGWGQRIPAVQLVEVDGLDAEPPQRRVQRGRQVTPGKAVPVRVLGGGKAALGRDHRAFACVRAGG